MCKRELGEHLFAGREVVTSDGRCSGYGDSDSAVRDGNALGGSGRTARIHDTGKVFWARRNVFGRRLLTQLLEFVIRKRLNMRKLVTNEVNCIGSHSRSS